MIYNGLVDVYDGEESPVFSFNVDKNGNAVDVETRTEMLNELWRQ